MLVPFFRYILDTVQRFGVGPERNRKMRDLNGKTVLVTGAARGMGKMHAQTFAREGARVVLTDVDGGELARAEEELRAAGHRVHAYAVDISSREACFELAARVEKEAGPVDVLINNAGIAFSEMVLDSAEDAVRRLTDVNYLAIFWMMQAFVPSMVRRKSGHVVNISSMAGKITAPYLGAYCGSKFAVIGLTDAIRQELRGSGVGFTIVCPGYVSTGMFEGAKPPMGSRWLEPQEIADTVLRAVKKGRCEVFMPHGQGWLSGFARGLGMPRMSDVFVMIAGGKTSFKGLRKDRGRPF